MAYNRHQTLTPATVATFTVSDASASAVEVLNRSGLDEVYISFDGTATPANPTVAGNDFDVVPAGMGAAVQIKRPGSAPIVIKVISASATAISVRGVA